MHLTPPAPLPVDKTQRRLFTRRLRREVYSPRWILLIALLVTALTATLTFLLGHKPLLREFEITLTIVALALFLFLFAGFYRGIRVRREKIDLTAPTPVPLGKLYKPLEYLQYVDFDIPDFGDALGCLLAIVIGLAALILIPFMAWVFANVVWVLIPLAAVTFYYLFTRALRQIFLRSHRTRHRLLPALGYALVYTTLYTGWLLALLLILDCVLPHRR